ncbi:MAG TPA: hypothetical protein VE422_37710 [Terriglobia bacterium]|nr:hypothetical protein [Terriglobia bacterium]
MTLIAGLVCKDSIVFAVDSEESGGITKSTVEKMRRVPEGGLLGALGHDPKKRVSVVVSGAGNGPLCDFAMQRITSEARKTSDQKSAILAIQDILIDIWKVHVPLYPTDPVAADFRLLVGLRAPGDYRPSLYSIQGTTIIERDKYFTFGSGSVTDYILEQMYSERMNTEDGIAAALYMLQIAKRYVAGVGGASHILVLRADGTVDEKPSWEISEEENIARSFNEISGTLLLSLLRTRSSPEANFKNHLKDFNKWTQKLRKKKKQSDTFLDNILKQIEENRMRAEEVKPSDAQKSEPGQ